MLLKFIELILINYEKNICRLLRVCAKMGRHTDTGHALYIVFHLGIEQGRIDRRTLVNSIYKVEALTSTAEIQSIMHALQEIHFVVGKYVFLFQNPVETVAIDRVIGRFVIYKDTNN